uniref:Histone-lysine N-methyltransferase SETD7 n=1 Tax=Lepeophtheirus salmonis TaxID=72036 RepID=D3PI03_LEPSM|nr:Histone-lysine N-methyltransferase SETD7 [Lepeophtheirus salmonis]
MKVSECESQDESKVEAFRQAVESLLDESSNIIKELTESPQFMDCVTKEDDKILTKEPCDQNGGCQLDLIGDFEQFSITNGLKLTSKLEESQLSFVNESLEDGIKFSGSFFEGKPHGFFRIMNKYGDLVFFGCFIYGRLHGQSLKSLVGGGFLLNLDHSNSEFSGDNIVYLYPDCQTAFVGSFDQSSMVSAQANEVINTRNNCCGLNYPIFELLNDVYYSQDISSLDKISKEPMLADPYESFFVFVKESKISGAGQGLFAKISVASGTVLAFYNGIRKPSVSLSESSFEDTPYKISLSKQTDMDIPQECISLDKYTSSLAHKVCHSFTPNCDFDKYDHPRFGVILSVVSLREILEGEELTVDYKYDLNVAPSWYKKAWAKHQKMIRGMPSWQKALSRKRRYRRNTSSLSSNHLNKIV